MRKEACLPGNAVEFWGRLLTYNPIVAVSGVTYPPISHGTPSQNKPIYEYQRTDLDTTFKAGKLPDWIPDGEMFAIGSLIYVVSNPVDAYPFTRTKSEVSRRLQKGSDLNRMEDIGVKPAAIVMVDLDCPSTKENLSAVNRILASGYESTDWIIFDSGGSFHIVFNRFVDPQELPMHYCEIIEKFLPLADERYQKEIADIARGMKINFDNPGELKRICNFIINKVAHMDSPEEKIKFVVDLRWIAHSITELLDYLETHMNGFAYLRIGPNSGGHMPKTERAYRVDAYSTRGGYASRIEKQWKSRIKAADNFFE